MGKKYQYREDTNRTHLVTVRFTDDEFARLNYICDRLNITKAEHIRSSVFQLGGGGPVFQLALDSESAHKLTAQFGKIGSNLNQIARQLNSGEPADKEIRDAINDCISDMNEELRFLRTARAYRGDLKTPECS